MLNIRTAFSLALGSGTTLPVFGTHQLSGRRGAGPVPGSRSCGFRLPRFREVSSLREPGQVCEAVRLQQWNARQPVASGGALNLRESSGSRSRSRETMSPAALGSRPGGTEAPLAYVFRALDLQNESTAAGAERLPALAN